MYGQIAKAVGASSRVFDMLDVDSSCPEPKTCKKEFYDKQNMGIATVHDAGFTYTTGNHALSKIKMDDGRIICSGSRMDYFNKHNEIISANQPVFNMTSAA